MVKTKEKMIDIKNELSRGAIIPFQLNVDALHDTSTDIGQNQIYFIMKLPGDNNLTGDSLVNVFWVSNAKSLTKQRIAFVEYTLNTILNNFKRVDDSVYWEIRRGDFYDLNRMPDGHIAGNALSLKLEKELEEYFNTSWFRIHKKIKKIRKVFKLQKQLKKLKKK